jgi:hypothetical protein
MIMQQQDKTDFSGRIIFLVLFFLCICAFSGKSVKKESHQIYHEFVSDLQPGSKAIIVHTSRTPAFNRFLVSFEDKFQFRLPDPKLKVFADNLKITQKLISLEKAQLFIKDVTFHRFYFLLFPEDSPEHPVLS